jgi:hypothetical protein
MCAVEWSVMESLMEHWRVNVAMENLLLQDRASRKKARQQAKGDLTEPPTNENICEST